MQHIGIRDAWSDAMSRTALEAKVEAKVGIGPFNGAAQSPARSPARSVRQKYVLMMLSSSVEEGTAGLLELGKLASWAPHLQTLNVSQSCIRLEGLRALVSAGLFRGHIRKLDLSRNELGDEGATFLASAQMFRSGALGSLDLRQCGIGDAGKRLLGSALFHRTQKELNFQSLIMDEWKSSELIEPLILRSKSLRCADIILIAGIIRHHGAHLKYEDVSACVFWNQPMPEPQGCFTEIDLSGNRDVCGRRDCDCTRYLIRAVQENASIYSFGQVSTVTRIPRSHAECILLWQRVCLCCVCSRHLLAERNRCL